MDDHNVTTDATGTETPIGPNPTSPVSSTPDSPIKQAKGAVKKAFAALTGHKG